MLRSVVENDECNTWDDYIPFLTSAYRSTEHKATGCTPNLLFFGREVRLPLDILAEKPSCEPKVFLPNDYAQWLQNAMSKAHHYARQHTGEYALKSKDNYDRKSSTWKPSKGEWVYRYYPPKAKNTKLSTPWMGPYVVTDVSMSRNATIAENPHARHIVVHIDQLKRVEGELQRKDNWIRDQQVPGVPDILPDTQVLNEDLVISPEHSDEEVDVNETIALTNDHVLNGVIDVLINETLDVAIQPVKQRTRFNEKNNQHLRYDPYRPILPTGNSGFQADDPELNHEGHTTPCVPRRKSKRRRRPPDRYGMKPE
jgi:hypothetical protein